MSFYEDILKVFKPERKLNDTAKLLKYLITYISENEEKLKDLRKMYTQQQNEIIKMKTTIHQFSGVSDVIEIPKNLMKQIKKKYPKEG